MMNMAEAIAASNRDVPAIVPLEFWKDHELTDKPGEFREVEYVKWAKKGSNGATTTERIARLSKRGSQGQIDPVWAVVEPYYQAWKKGQELPVHGTPLDALPFLTKGQIAHFKMLNIRSAEDLASVTDADMERMGMGARQARTMAATYVQAKNGDAQIAAAMASKDAQINDLQTQLADLKSTVDQLTATLPRRDKPADVAKK